RPYAFSSGASMAFWFIGTLGIGLGFLLAMGTQVSLQAQEPLGKSSRTRVDGDGIPLPEGAIARLGTLTLRGCHEPITYTPDGKYFVCNSGFPRWEIPFFEPETGRRAFALGAVSSGSRMQFSPDGRRLACATFGSYHNPAWDVDSRKQLFKFEASQAGFSADSSRLITVSYYGKGHCRVLDSTSGRLLAEYSLEAQINWAEVFPDGMKIVY